MLEEVGVIGTQCGDEFIQQERCDSVSTVLFKVWVSEMFPHSHPGKNTAIADGVP